MAIPIPEDSKLTPLGRHRACVGWQKERAFSRGGLASDDPACWSPLSPLPSCHTLARTRGSAPAQMGTINIHAANVRGSLGHQRAERGDSLSHRFQRDTHQQLA
eukprot:5996431-Prymnesium_polylepis.2